MQGQGLNLITNTRVFRCLTSIFCVGLLGLFTIGWTDTVPQTPDQPLTLQQAYQKALAGNLTIKTAQAQTQEAQADIAVAKTRPNPSLNWDLSKNEDTYRLAGIEQVFEVPGKHMLRVRVAKEHALGAQADYQQVVHSVLIQVRQAYINWMGALIRAEIQADNTHIANALKSIADTRFRAGDVAELDVIQASLLLNQAKNDELEAQSQVRQTQTILAGLLNTPTFTPPAKPAEAVEQLYEPPPLDASLQDALKNRPDLQSKAKALQAQRDQIRLYRLSIVPDLTLQAGYDLVVNPTKHGSYISGRVDLPILDRQQGNLAKAKATYQRLLAERALLEQQIRTDVTVSYENVTSQQAQWDNYIHTILPEAKDVETLAQQSYQAGKTGIGDALLAHQNTLAVRQQALQAFSSYQQAINDLESALGRNPGVAP